MPPPSRRPGYVRPSRRLSRVIPAAVIFTGGSSGSGDEYLRQAAEVVSKAAKAIAATWSKKIPAMMYTTLDGNTATIHAYAPNARPAEFRLMHPVFGDRKVWRGPPGAPFLAPGLDASVDEALLVYMKSIDAYAKKLGWS